MPGLPEFPDRFLAEEIANLFQAPVTHISRNATTGASLEAMGIRNPELRDVEVRVDFGQPGRPAGTLLGLPVYIVDEVSPSREIQEADQRAEALLRSYGPEGVTLAEGDMVAVRSKRFPEVSYAISPYAETPIEVLSQAGFCGVICILPIDRSPPADVLLSKLLLCKADEQHLWTTGNYSDHYAIGMEKTLPRAIRGWIEENRRQGRRVGELWVNTRADMRPIQRAVAERAQAMQEFIQRVGETFVLRGDPSAGRPQGILAGTDATVRVLTPAEAAKENAQAMLQEQRKFVESRQSPAALETPLNIDPCKSRYWFAPRGRRIIRPGPAYASGGCMPAAARAPPEV